MNRAVSAPCPAPVRAAPVPSRRARAGAGGRRPRLASLGLRCAAAVFLLHAPAAPANDAFDAWVAGLRAEALAAGIGEKALDEALAGLAPIPRVIELDRRQPESRLTAAEYLDRVAPESRIRDARERFARHRPLLDDIAGRYGVQPRFIVALWGIETDFGRNTGNYGVIAALATLAHDGRRSAFFRRELLAALRILDEGHIALADMNGSWAGAMGQSQFMPTSFLAYAIDHDGDGRRDIWGTLEDVFASIANYLARAGWRDDMTWGREARLPQGFDPGLIGLRTVKLIGAWQALGVRRPDGSDLPTRPLPASIVRPDGPGARAWMVYDNFRATLKWNRSIPFALAVGRLADRMAAP